MHFALTPAKDRQRAFLGGGICPRPPMATSLQDTHRSRLRTSEHIRGFIRVRLASVCQAVNTFYDRLTPDLQLHCYRPCCTRCQPAISLAIAAVNSIICSHVGVYIRTVLVW